MSIINNASKGSNIEALYLLDRTITQFSLKNPDKYLPEDKLMLITAPNNLFEGDEKDDSGSFKRLVNPEKKVRETLAFWGENGLWDVSKEGVKSHSILDNSDQLPKRLLKLIASKEYDLLNGNDIEPFLRFLTLFLCIDEITFVGQQILDGKKAGELVEKLVADDLVNNAMSLNTNERPFFFSYAYLLGFLEQIDKRKYFVDPTRAIKIFLPDIFKDKKHLYFSEFLSRLNACLPVFDEGEYRLLVEDKMIRDVDDWSPDKGIRLSASLSIAIERLCRERRIVCDLGSDSKNRYYLTLPNGIEKIISNIQYLED